MLTLLQGPYDVRCNPSHRDLESWPADFEASTIGGYLVRYRPRDPVRSGMDAAALISDLDASALVSARVLRYEPAVLNDVRPARC